MYSPNNKPTPSSIGAAASSHTHDYLPLAGGTITGNLRLKGSGNFGNKLNFGDGEYVYLHEASDDKLTLYSKSGIDFAASSTSQPFNVKGQLQENGQRVYSPNNKPPQATTSADGLMSAADKSKLNGIAAGAQVNPAYATASLILDRPTNTDGYYQTGASNSSSYMNSVGSSNTVARGDHKHSLFIPDATTSKPGLMSKTDKANLNSLMSMRIVGLYQFNASGGLYSSYGMTVFCKKGSTTDPVTNKTVDCYAVTLSGGDSSKAYYAIIIPGTGYTGTVSGRCAGQQSINVVLYKAGTNTATLANSGMLVLIETA